MVVRIRYKSGGTRIFPLVTDMTLTDKKLIVFRKYPDSVKSVLDNIDEEIKREDIDKMEVVGL